MLHEIEKGSEWRARECFENETRSRGNTVIWRFILPHNFMDHQKWCKVTPQRPLCDVSKRLVTSQGHNDKNAADLFHDARNGPLLSS